MGKKRQPQTDDSVDDDSGHGSSNDDRELKGDAPLGEQTSVEDDIRIDDGDDDTRQNNNSHSRQSSETEGDADEGLRKTNDKPKKVRKLKLVATEDFNAKLRKRGILYLSRVPPRMGPAKVKTLLSDFGTIARVYLVEEDKTARKRRRRAGGSSGKRYTEGWVEFESKKVAKSTGETLNMTKVTNHKGSIHYDDLWSVKYLRGFKWSHLTEKVAYERRVREQKLRVEMMEVRRENASYIAQVEAGKKLDYIDARRKKRGHKDGGSGGGVEGDAGMAKKKRKIRQKTPLNGERSSAKSAILGSLV